MEWIANQPVQFGVADPCGMCEEIPNQLSDNTDAIQVQFRIDNCGTAQLLEDFSAYPYNTWVLNDGWQIDTDLCHSGLGVLNATVELDDALFPAGYYQFTVVVTSFEGSGALRLKYGVFPSYDVIGDITGVGTWSFWAYIVPAGVPPNVLLFSPQIAGLEVCMSSISIYKINTAAKIAAYDSDGTYIDEIGVVSNPSLFVFVEDTVTVTIDWSDLAISNRCAYLCLLDPCLNSNGQNYNADILNPSFTINEAGWDLSFSASWVAGTIHLGNGATTGILYQDPVFLNYAPQSVVIVVSAITGSLVVSFGTATIQTITSAGTYIVSGTPVDNLSITLTSPAGSTATIDSVSPKTVTTAQYTCNQQSNTFKIGDYTGDCTKLISASNTENGLGFVFVDALGSASGFVPKIRLESKLKGMKYPSERSVYEDSAGTKVVTYFSGRKAKTFTTDLQPEYVHDFLRLLFGIDNFYIDGVLYFVEDDEYNVDIPGVNDNVGSVKFLVSTRTQDVKNTNC